MHSVSQMRLLSATMGKASKGIECRLYEKVTRFAGNLGNEASTASVVFPTTIVEWIRKIRGMVIVLHALLSQ